MTVRALRLEDLGVEDSTLKTGALHEREADQPAAPTHYFGTMNGSPPGVPGGGITGVTPPPTGGAAMPGSTPAGGQMMPFDCDSRSLRVALPVVSPKVGAVPR
jgi:cytochrome c1